MTAQLIIHGARGPGGRAAGPPTTLTMRREVDPVEVARTARNLLLSGAWRTAPKTGGALAKAEYLLRLKVPAALALFPKPALHALTRRHPEPGCRWCNVAYFAALALEPEPAPDDALMELLGRPCGPCAVRLRDRALVAVTASLPPPRPGPPGRRPRPAARPRPLAGRKPPDPPYWYRRRGWPGTAGRPLDGWTAERLYRAITRRAAS